MKKGLILVILCALVLTLATGCSRKEESLRMEVQNIVASGDNQILSVNIQNNTGSTVSYGWVNSCKFQVTTDQGRFVCDAPFMGRIPQGDSTEKIKLSDCPGEVKSIVITELCLLNNNGLPDKELHDLTLYNSKKDVTSFEDSFGFFDNPDWFSGIMFKLVPVFIVFVLFRNVIRLFFGRKLRSIFRSRRGFHIPSFHANFHDHNAQSMHDQAVQMANNAHMQEVNRQFHEDMHHHTQEAMDFGMKSVTPIDQGGFVPPPEPPMFF